MVVEYVVSETLEHPGIESRKEKRRVMKKHFPVILRIEMMLEKSERRDEVKHICNAIQQERDSCPRDDDENCRDLQSRRPCQARGSATGARPVTA